MKLLREIIEPHLETLLGSKGIERGMWASALEPSRESDQGDLTLPCFAFASILRQAPQQIADTIVKFGIHKCGEWLPEFQSESRVAC